MIRIPSVKPSVLLTLLLISGMVAKGQDPALYRQKMASLLQQYQQHNLPDTAYLDAVDTTITVLLNDDSLVSLLSVYRQLAFGNTDKRMARYRKAWYACMAFYSFNKDQYGSAIYYSEKNNDEAVRAGIFEKGGIAHSDQFAIGVYSQNHDYTRVLNKYRSLRSGFSELPAHIRAGKVSPEQANVGFTMLTDIVHGAYVLRDTALAGEAVGISAQMLQETERLPVKYKSYQALFRCAFHSADYWRAMYEEEGSVVPGQGSKVQEPVRGGKAEILLQAAIGEMRSRDFPEEVRTGYAYDLYTTAFDYYFYSGRTDSARYYLDLVRAMPDSAIKLTGIRQNFLLESNSKLLALQGKYADAWKDLRKLYTIRDSSFYAVSSDKDNNLYALAMAENTRTELLQAEAKREDAERSNIILFSLLALVAMGGGIGLLLFRSREKRQLLNLQLALARNFHDEIGPMLLYANTLVTKESGEHPSSRLEELKGQLAHIMDAVRGISHDLKSTELSTAGSLHKDTGVLLEKLKQSTGIDYTLTMVQGGRILSHWQYTNLRKILNELITNSIRHGECSLIRIGINASGNTLDLHYTDNGKGFAGVDGNPAQGAGGGSPEGIGLQNIRERTAMLNGRFSLQNDFPMGYSIDISIPLL